MASDTTAYSAQTIQWIQQEKNNIEYVANTLGVPATAIAGFMAKECTDYYIKSGSDKVKGSSLCLALAY